MSQESLKWYQRKELWGLVAIGGLVGSQFPSHTAMYKIGVSLNGIVAIGATFFGIKDGVKNQTLLPSGLKKK